MSTLDDVVAQLEQARDDYHTLVDEIDQAGTWKDRSPQQGWNNKQLLTHVANGVNRIPRTALRIKAGKGLNPRGPLMAAFNHLSLWETRYSARKATPESLKALYDRGHQLAVDTAGGMADDDWTRAAMVMGEERNVRDSFGYIVEHLNEHAASMRRAAS